MKHWMLGAFIWSALTPLLAHPTVDSSAWSNTTARLNQLMEVVRTNQVLEVRQETSEALEQELTKALETPGSYDHDFATLQGISIVQPASKRLRIFTWQLYIDKDHYRYLGFIQTEDGKVYPLKDGSDEMRTVEFSTFRAKDWYGALYYNLHPFMHEGKELYLLMGYDAYSFYNRRKVIDVLYFDDKGEPRFGKSVLEMKDGRGQLRTVKRFLVEYASSVNVTLNYSEVQDMVIYDHLVYGAPIPGGGPSSVPDGSYCGLKYNVKTGTWQYVDKVHRDDPNNILVDATSYQSIILNNNERKKRKKKKDLFGRMR